MRIILDFLRRYAAPYWLWYVGGFACLFGTNWLAVQIPLALAVGVDALSPMDQGAVTGAALRIAAMGAGVIFIRTASRVLIFTPGRLIEFQLKNELFEHLLTLPATFYDRWQTGDIVSRASNDMSFVRVLAGFGTLQVVNVSVAVALTGYQMLKLSPTLTAVVLAPVCLGLAMAQLGIRKLFNLTRQSQEQLSALSSHVLSSLQGVQTIQGFTAEEAFIDRFLEKNERYLETNLALARIRALYFPLLPLGGAVSVWALLHFGGPLAANGALSVGELVAFTTFIAYLLAPLRSLGWLLNVYQRGQVSLQRINELLELSPDRPEGDAPAPPSPGEPGRGPGLDLRGLTFRYPGADAPALDGVTAALPAGARIGIFGRTGSGKTTLLRLIARTYPPPPGAVFVDGVDLTTLDLYRWRRRLTAAPQVPFLFSESIAENISMGEGRAPDDASGAIPPSVLAKVEAAVQKVALSGDISRLPSGLETLVGERGVMLSGGQRQRTALARALYQDFELLLLDDVLSAVDHHTEQQIITALTELGRGEGTAPTVILVSHRMSVLATCDHVLVLDEGRLVDQGPHDALLKRPGLYREAWESGQEASAAPAVEGDRG